MLASKKSDEAHKGSEAAVEERGMMTETSPAPSVSGLNRPLLGLLAGTGLGVLDGLTALISAPELSGEIAGIVIGSSMKGLLAGLITGLIARKMANSTHGVLIGLVVALLVTAPIAHMNASHYGDVSYYWKIMLPGALVGALAGFIVIRYGRPAKAAKRDQPG
jgi:hypothetical protein